MASRHLRSVSASPAARTRMSRPQREQQMYEVAGRIFAERGFHATTMDEIAEAVGVSKQMIYNYMGSKEELYLALLRSSAEELIRRFDAAATEDVEPDVQLFHGIVAFFAFVEERREAWWIVSESRAAGEGAIAAEYGKLRQGIARLVSQLFVEARLEMGLPEKETEPSALALVAVGEELALWWLDHPEESKEAMAKRFMDYMWMGLGELARGREWIPPTPTATEH
jgi:AcrR family transcriptional regulator